MNRTRLSKSHFYSPFARRWHKWLWVLMGALLLSTLIELAHDHNAHASAREAADCAICQHSVSFDKTLPSATPLPLPVFGVMLVLVPLVRLHTKTISLSFRSRAPPAVTPA